MGAFAAGQDAVAGHLVDFAALEVRLGSLAASSHVASPSVVAIVDFGGAAFATFAAVLASVEEAELEDEGRHCSAFVAASAACSYFAYPVVASPACHRLPASVASAAA